MISKTKPSPHAKKSSDTVESVMSTLTKEAVAKIADTVTREPIEELRVRALGIATVTLSTDKVDMGRAEVLKENGLTLDKAKGYVAQANVLLAAHQTRLDKEAAAKAATADELKAREKTWAVANSATNLFRAALGNTSADLPLYGVTVLGAHSAPKPKAKPADEVKK